MAEIDRMPLGVSEANRISGLPSDTEEGWRWLGWFSLILVFAGVGDWILAWIPLRIGSPEWEFGTIVSTFSGLPLVTMGFAGLLGSALARHSKWLVVTVAIVLLVFAGLIVAALLLFLLDVPVAMAATGDALRVGIRKAIIKTAGLGVLFSVTYAVAGIAALRHVRRLARSGRSVPRAPLSRATQP